jgi:hypothetical protein
MDGIPVVRDDGSVFVIPPSDMRHVCLESEWLAKEAVRREEATAKERQLAAFYVARDMYNERGMLGASSYALNVTYGSTSDGVLQVRGTPADLQRLVRILQAWLSDDAA